ncbi:MAG: potassium-transporting ATPase subunit KdpC [Flavobacteriales bacterium]|nr:potassium-transporting ATPase subunit KdpC [Flavobacteriales bacterium]
MKTNLIPALRMTAVMLVLCSVLYTLIVLGFAKAVTPSGGSVELVVRDGTSVGGANVGQTFSGDRYFQGRPSAVDYNGAGSGGSNKGPSNPDHLAAVQARIDTFLVHNPGVSKAEIPSELVTASGSGLDPDMSPDGARIQAKRIAAARMIPEEAVLVLIDQHTHGPLLGLFGPATVNVLELNLTLDALKN